MYIFNYYTTSNTSSHASGCLDRFSRFGGTHGRNQHTKRHTDHATCSVAICRIYAMHAMRPNRNVDCTCVVVVMVALLISLALLTAQNEWMNALDSVLHETVISASRARFVTCYHSCQSALGVLSKTEEWADGILVLLAKNLHDKSYRPKSPEQACFFCRRLPELYVVGARCDGQQTQ